MTKKELISKLQEKVNGLTKADASIILGSLSEVIIEAVKADDCVTLPGIGKFESKEVPEKTGTYIAGSKAGQTYVIPAHKAPKFKFSETIKNAVR